MEHKINIEEVIDIAIEAGKATLEIYDQDFEVIQKADNSPLTMADERSNAIIIKGLSELSVGSELPVISEETKLLSYEERKDWDILWLVDPLDGTKEFIKKNGEFTINIALVKNGLPVLGVIYVPVREVLYYAIEGKGTFMRAGGVESKLKLRELEGNDKLLIVASRSHKSEAVEAYVSEKKKQFREVDYVPAGSSLKFCLLAEGKADVYPRLAPTMEWDTGAGHIIAKEAGAQVLVYGENTELQYNKENLLNPHFIVKNPKLN
ncbi:MAG: 3'(2'),5'-bisphosphate nucleotidase CysQ [Bacteroidetes bacterium]|nr:3'(2'),5'-bisphosphate nucleotidase CysQ [Bacteroidota bacterium]